LAFNYWQALLFFFVFFVQLSFLAPIGASHSQVAMAKATFSITSFKIEDFVMTNREEVYRIALRGLI
jgi:predicted transcriptional regulator